MDTTNKNGDAFKVDCFVEKPNITLAKQYVTSGHYAWNSGMFIWKLSSILDNFSRYLPQMSDGLNEIKTAIGTPDAVSYTHLDVYKRQFSSTIRVLIGAKSSDTPIMAIVPSGLM